MGVESVSGLQDHVQRAVALELSTVPVYLYAYYSIDDPLSGAAQTIRSVVMQEMAHVCLATNLLVAIGSTPRFDDAGWVPTFPSPLPHHEPELVLRLQPVSVPVVRDVFCAIERPMTVRYVPEGGEYTTIGQFYEAITRGLRRLVAQHGEASVFVGEPWRQLVSGYHGGYAGATGQLVEVLDLPSALLAVKEIVRQGEGSAHGENDGTGELAHFWRFNQIADTTVRLGRVLPVVTDPSVADLPPGPLRDLAQLFDDSFGLLLRLMQRVWSEPDTAVRGRLIATLVPVMIRVLGPIARTLVRTPIPGRDVNAGPGFGFSATPQPEIVETCTRLASTYPALASVAQALRLLPAIDVAVSA